MNHSSARQICVPRRAHCQRVARTEHRYPDRSTYQKTITYHNGLSIPVTVIDRAGVLSQQPADVGPGRTRYFTVRVVYRFLRSVNFDTEDLYGVVSQNPSEETKAVTQAIREAPDHEDKSSGTRFVIEYTFTEKELASREEGYYFHELDVVLTTSPNPINITHPESPQGHAARELNDRDQAEQFRYDIRIVDNHQRLSRRFVYIGGQVYEVPIIADPDQTDGIYITSSKDVDDDSSDTASARTRRYDLDAKEVEIGLYSSMEEAQTQGNYAKVREKELERQLQQAKVDVAEANRRTAQIRRDAEKERQAYERKKQAYDEAKSRIERDAAAEREQRKNRQQKGEQTRKMVLETLRFIPSVITAVTGLVVLYQRRN